MKKTKKIAWIENKYHLREIGYKTPLDKYLKENNLESKVDIEEILEKINEKFRLLDKYKTLLLRGEAKNTNRYKDIILKKHPNLRIYYLTYDPNEFSKEERKELNVFSVAYSRPETIEKSDLGKLLKELTGD